MLFSPYVLLGGPIALVLLILGLVALIKCDRKDIVPIVRAIFHHREPPPQITVVQVVTPTELNSAFRLEDLLAPGAQEVVTLEMPVLEVGDAESPRPGASA